MPSAVLRPLLGDVNGANTDFQTPAPYVPGSLAVWVNGQLRRADLNDGWQELGGSGVRMKQVPQPGDVLQAFFRPAL